jgi:thioesterase domain-containing protein
MTIPSVIDTATLLSILRDRDVRLWAEGDQVKCSAPVGAIDAEMQAVLAQRKSEILALLRQAEALTRAPPAIVPIKPSGSKRPLFAVSGHGGDVFYLLALARHLDAEQPVLGVQPPGLDGSEPIQSIEALARYQIEQIRRCRPRGPYLIAGHCAGGTVAFEVAQQLTAAGQQVALLALIGSPFPKTFRYASQLWLQIRRNVRALSSGSLLERKWYVMGRLQQRRQRSEAETGGGVARQRVEGATMAAVRNYKPRRYPGQIDLFITADKWHQCELWGSVAESVHEHNLRYFLLDDLLLGPHVDVLAASLQGRLTSVQIAIDKTYGG